jgi:hypothetical protein
MTENRQYAQRRVVTEAASPREFILPGRGKWHPDTAGHGGYERGSRVPVWAFLAALGIAAVAGAAAIGFGIQRTTAPAASAASKPAVNTAASPSAAPQPDQAADARAQAAAQFGAALHEVRESVARVERAVDGGQVSELKHISAALRDLLHAIALREVQRPERTPPVQSPADTNQAAPALRAVDEALAQLRQEHERLKTDAVEIRKSLAELLALAQELDRTLSAVDCKQNNIEVTKNRLEQQKKQLEQQAIAGAPKR